MAANPFQDPPPEPAAAHSGCRLGHLLHGRAIEAAVALLSAAVILAGVLTLGWRVFDIVFLFWAENVVIGALHLIRLAAAAGARGIAAKVVLLPFFTVHYGMFCLVHGIFVFVLFGRDHLPNPSPDGLIATAPSLLHGNLLVGFAAIAIQQVVTLIRDLPRVVAYDPARAAGLMFSPYGRIVVLHVALLGGGFALHALGSPIWGLVLLVLLKAALDLGLLAHAASQPPARPQFPDAT